MTSTTEMPALDLTAALSDKQLALHPFCRVCGWTKGGVDSWSGGACTCGHREPTFRELLKTPATCLIGMTNAGE